MSGGTTAANGQVTTKYILVPRSSNCECIMNAPLWVQCSQQYDRAGHSIVARLGVALKLE